MKITVTQEDIDKGVKKDCQRCPIVRAMRRALGKTVYIGRLDYYIGGDWNSLSNLSPILTPDAPFTHSPLNCRIESL